MKHTKGKWWACCTGKDSKSHYVFAGDDAAVCAMMSNDPTSSDYESLEGTITLKERQANAKLLAAAPELLEACSDLLGLLRFHGYHISTEINKAIQAINNAKS